MAGFADILASLEGGTKAKLAALDQLADHVSARAVSRDQVSALLDMSGQLLGDNNFKARPRGARRAGGRGRPLRAGAGGAWRTAGGRPAVALKLLNCWESIAASDHDVIRPYMHALLPHTVERLGDNRQEVRQAACNLMLELLQVVPPHVMMEKLGRFWGHKHWKVRHGLLQFVAEAVATTGEAALLAPRDEAAWVLHKVIALVGDPESAVRDAAVECLEEVYKVYGEALVDIIGRHALRPAHLNAIYARLAQMGADVAPTPTASGGGASDQASPPHHAAGGAAAKARRGSAGGAAAYEDPDTACSGAPDTGVLEEEEEAAAEEEEQEYREAAYAPAPPPARRQLAPALVEPAAPTARRGGYKDGGGVAADGGLPPVAPVHVASERELRAEVERIAATLGRGPLDWEKRVAAMVRLEALVKGGAAGAFEGPFAELLRGLKDLILEQMVDRRSAVARQAAHLMEVLAAGLGPRFEPYALPCMAALFKGLVITVQARARARVLRGGRGGGLTAGRGAGGAAAAADHAAATAGAGAGRAAQVVSESADLAARGILHHCRAPRLVPQLCDILTKDRSAKLRKHCSAFLLQARRRRPGGRGAPRARSGHSPRRSRLTRRAAQMVEDWEPSEYGHHLDALEAAIAAASQDALSETRAAGRSAFAAYAAQLPDRASALLRRLDGGLQQKLHEAVAAYSRGAAQQLAHVVPERRAERPASAKPWRAPRPASAAEAQPEVEIVVMAPPPARPPRSARTTGTYQRAPLPAGGAPGSGGSHAHAQQPAAAAPAAPAPAAALAMPAPATLPARGRKSVAGLPMRVPGPSLGDAGSGAPGELGPAAAALAAAGGRRRTSVMPQRVALYQPESPPRGRGLGGEAGKLLSAPGSPDSCAHSEASATHSVGGGGGDARAGHHGAATRLYSAHPKPHLAHPAALQQQQHGGISRTASATDDLQLLAALRDQQAAAQQAAATHHHQQQAAAAAVAYHQHAAALDGLAAQASAASLFAAAPARPATLAKAVAGVLANPKGWQERVERINALADALARQAEGGGPPEAFLELEKTLPKLLAAMDDAHFKVSLAGLAALQMCLDVCPHVMEPSLDKLMPLLFLKLCAAKPAQRSAAESALQTCAVRLSADALLPALNRSLDSMKQPAARVSVMEFTVLFLGDGKAAGVPTSATHLRTWLGKNVPLLLDKNPNVRAMAGRALATMYAMDPHSVAACLQHATSQEVLAVQRSLAAAEARAAAEEDDEAAASAAGLTDRVAAWAHRGHWGTHGGASTSSSMDLSTASAGGAEQAAHGLAAGQPAAPAPVHAAPAAQAAPQQQLPAAGGGSHSIYQHQAGAADAQSVCSSPGAAAQPGGGAVARDLLGRPVAAAPDAGHTTTTCVGAGAGAGAAALLGLGSANGSGAGSAFSSSGGGLPGAGAGAPPPSPPEGGAISAAAASAAAAAAAGDAGSQARHLTVLVHRLQSRPGEDVLAELAACAGTVCKQAWEENFQKVLLAGLSAAQNSHEPIRELAFLLVLALARAQGELFEPVLDVVLQPLLAGCADASREVLVAAQQALDVLMASQPPLRCVDILAHKLPSDEATASGTAVDGEVLCGTIRCLQAVCRRMAPGELLAVAPARLLPGLFAAFNHPRPDVRKAVVFCLVDVWLAAGDGLTPHLSSLPCSQLKLLTIYYNRSQAGTQQRAHSPRRRERAAPGPPSSGGAAAAPSLAADAMSSLAAAVASMVPSELVSALAAAAAFWRGLPFAAVFAGHCCFCAMAGRGLRDRFALHYVLTFLWGNGGGVVTALLLMAPQHAKFSFFASNEVLGIWTACWWLVSYCPGELPYRLLSHWYIKLFARSCTALLRAMLIVSRVRGAAAGRARALAHRAATAGRGPATDRRRRRRRARGTAQVDLAVALYPGIAAAPLLLGTLAGCGGRLIADALLTAWGALPGLAELSSPGFVSRSAALAAASYYALAHAAGVLPPDAAAGLVITTLVRPARVGARGAHSVLHSAASEATGLDLDFTAPVARLLHTLTCEHARPSPARKRAPASERPVRAADRPPPPPPLSQARAPAAAAAGAGAGGGVQQGARPARRRQQSRQAPRAGGGRRRRRGACVAGDEEPNSPRVVKRAAAGGEGSLAATRPRRSQRRAVAA
ncbi:clasp1b [Scenedesmus sp. PABB004]|nr:clasp1b [Scenedesmus sp. PABB004]